MTCKQSIFQFYSNRLYSLSFFKIYPPPPLSYYYACHTFFFHHINIPLFILSSSSICIWNVPSSSLFPTPLYDMFFLFFSHCHQSPHLYTDRFINNTCSTLIFQSVLRKMRAWINLFALCFLQTYLHCVKGTLSCITSVKWTCANITLNERPLACLSQSIQFVTASNVGLYESILKVYIF